MSRHNDQISMKQMLDHAREAVVLCRSKTEEGLPTDRMLSLAVTRLLEILGEAANRVSPVTRSKHPEIPWPDVIGLRNRLIHAYDQIDLHMLWEVVSDDLPPLIAALEKMLSQG